MVTNCTLYFLHRRCESVNAVNCELLTFTLRVGPYRLGPNSTPWTSSFLAAGSTFHLPGRTFRGERSTFGPACWHLPGVTLRVNREGVKTAQSYQGFSRLYHRKMTPVKVNLVSSRWYDVSRPHTSDPLV